MPLPSTWRMTCNRFSQRTSVAQHCNLNLAPRELLDFPFDLNLLRAEIHVFHAIMYTKSFWDNNVATGGTPRMARSCICYCSNISAKAIPNAPSALRNFWNVVLINY